MRLRAMHFAVMAALLAGCSMAGAAQDMPAPGNAKTSAATSGAQADGKRPAVETVVFLRHGEKPADGAGQLTPQGLNRAIALSVVLPKMFGRPDYLFAPDPREKVSDRGGLFNYVRPLATIEPTAIRLDMPVQTPCGYRDIDELNHVLSSPRYARATIFVAWEHGYARSAAAGLFKTFGGNASKVPSWPGNDYDSLYVVTIHRTAGHAPTATFAHEHEGLDGQSKVMPSPGSGFRHGGRIAPR